MSVPESLKVILQREYYITGNKLIYNFSFHQISLDFSDEDIDALMDADPTSEYHIFH